MTCVTTYQQQQQQAAAVPSAAVSHECPLYVAGPVKTTCSSFYATATPQILCNYASCFGGVLFSSLSKSRKCTSAWSLLLNHLTAPVAVLLPVSCILAPMFCLEPCSTMQRCWAMWAYGTWQHQNPWCACTDWMCISALIQYINISSTSTSNQAE